MILVDTGYWYALANKRDRHHARAKEVSQTVTEQLVTTWPVLTETCHLLLRLGETAQTAFVRFLERGAVEVFELSPDHFGRIASLMQKYATLPMDLADASLVIAAEDLGSGRILSTDERDFQSLRWKNRRPFTNLLLRK